MVEICASKQYTLVPKLARETYLVRDGARGLLVRDHAKLHEGSYRPGNAPPAVGSHDARVKGITVDAEGPDSARELAREEHVGELGDLVFPQAGDGSGGAPNRIEVDASGGIVRLTRHVHDARAPRRQKPRHQQHREQEVAEVIGPEPELEAVLADCAAGRRKAGVVEENIDRCGQRQDAPSGLPDRGKVGEVESDEARRASSGMDGIQNRGASL